MNILIDCYELIKGHGKSIGIYNYTQSLLEHLIPILSKKYKVFIICNENNYEDFQSKEADIIIANNVPYNAGEKIFWEMYLINRYIKKNKIDLYYSPRGFVPIIKKTKMCITMHDLIPFYYRERYRKNFENLYITYRLKQSSRKSDKIITISNFSKNEIIQKLDIHKDKIRVIYNGINKQISAKEMDIKEPYIFAIASNLPHKNLYGILKSYEKYFEMCSSPIKLKISGVKKHSEYLSSFPKEMCRNIEFLSFLETEELYGYYKSADCFLFLSEIEGFGFPPLEAMSIGTPVICSKIQCLEEILGEAAIFVSPYNYLEIANSIIKLQNDCELKTQLISRGFEILSNYCWDKCAEDVYYVMEEILN